MAERERKERQSRDGDKKRQTGRGRGGRLEAAEKGARIGEEGAAE